MRAMLSPWCSSSPRRIRRCGWAPAIAPTSRSLPRTARRRSWPTIAARRRSCSRSSPRPSPAAERRRCRTPRRASAVHRPSAQVLGVSMDTLETQTKFAESLDLPFPLLADPEGVAAKAYGVANARRLREPRDLRDRQGRQGHERDRGQGRHRPHGNAQRLQARAQALGRVRARRRSAPPGCRRGARPAASPRARARPGRARRPGTGAPLPATPSAPPRTPTRR